MTPLNSSILLGILIAVAILTYVSILRKLKPEKILVNMASDKGSEKQKPEKKKEDKSRIKEKGDKSRNEEKVGKSRSEEKKKKKTEEFQETPSTCLHDFGYLGTLPRNTSIPDECLGCAKIIDCLAQR